MVQNICMHGKILRILGMEHSQPGVQIYIEARPHHIIHVHVHAVYVGHVKYIHIHVCMVVVYTDQ